MHCHLALSLTFGRAELEMATSFLLGCCIAQAPTSPIPFQQLGYCGKPAGESHQPQECGELLEAAEWGWVLIPAQGMMGGSHLL